MDSTTIISIATLSFSIVMICILSSLHFFWWKKRNDSVEKRTFKVERETSIITEIKKNIFLIICSIFVISAGVSLFALF
ncbi:hypothetical protein NPX79_02070 [Spiroplasma endosymbiont of Anurida maritima]|uniref:hypothetical protein n=1 Tax=Spiroplasma endosymbiont of Anurida maritima TaxID=2967972 RepID=UPI0036D2251F